VHSVPTHVTAAPHAVARGRQERVDRPPRERQRPPPPDGDEGLGNVRRAGTYRQRMDMTSPATIAPKPIAKFHGPSETMNGILSPAT